jgi:hypothetical protein
MNNKNYEEFQKLLSWESWENIFENNNVNIMFNNFHNTYLRCFYTCFPKKEKLNPRIITTSGSHSGLEYHAEKRNNF